MKLGGKPLGSSPHCGISLHAIALFVEGHKAPTRKRR